MKVLFISGGDQRYGAPKALMELVLSLKENYDIVPVVLTKKKGPLNEWCDSYHIENYSFWYRDTMAGSAYNSTLLNFIKQLIKFCLYIYGGFIQHKVLKIIPDLASFDIIHTNLNRIDIGSYISKKTGVPQVCHLRELRNGHSKIVQYSSKVTGFLIDSNIMFFAISKITARNWIEAGIPKNKICLAYDGIDLEYYGVRKNLDVKKSRYTLVCVGRLEKNKGQHQIIKAMHLLDESIKNRVELILVGESYPEYKKKLDKMIVEYNLKSQVVFLGYVADMREVLEKCDIGITASRGEAFGRVTVEYMAAGLVTIVSDTGANKEIVDDEINGYIYQFNNSADLALKIEKTIIDRTKTKEILSNASEKVLEFSKNNNAQCVYSAYKDILREV